MVGGIKTILPTLSMEELSSPELVPGTKKVGVCYSSLRLLRVVFWKEEKSWSSNPQDLR